MAWMDVAKAAKKHNVLTNQIHSVRNSGIVPEWMEKRGIKWFVDDKHPGFVLHLKSKVKKAIAARVGHAKIKRKESMDKSEVDILSSPETLRLQELSIQADLSKSITDLRLQMYKIEVAKLKLEQQAGDLISRYMADFLYFGYLERLNRELLIFPNKLEADFDKMLADVIVRVQEGEDVVAADVAREMKNLTVNEIEDIIRTIKKEQLKGIRQFAKEAGIKL